MNKREVARALRICGSGYMGEDCYDCPFSDGTYCTVGGERGLMQTAAEMLEE